MTAFAVAACVLFLWGIAELALWGLIQWHRPFFPWLITPRDEAPDIPTEVAAAHAARSFDPELGWCRRPGEHATEKTDRGTVTFSVDAHGARTNPGFEDRVPEIACFGDSFTFCRLVDDDHTWPHMLSRRTGRATANYGVGNYGLDQALLRLERELPALEAQIVVMGVVPETIARIQSAWKHYFEYGNTLAFKPRFTLSGPAGSGALMHHPPAVTCAEEYADYRTRLDGIRRDDPFYRSKFRRDMLRFPFLPRLALRARRHVPILWHLTRGRLLGRPDDAFRRAFRVILAVNARTSTALYQDASATRLLRALTERFAQLCRDAGKQPLLVVLPQPSDLAHSRNAEARESFYASLAGTLPVADLTGAFRSHPEPSSLYVDGRLGPHASATGNRLIARELAAHIARFGAEPHPTKEFQ
ncbi:SGNH/GDSL hydrolase family protein [Streptomyces mauvecolor]